MVGAEHGEPYLCHGPLRVTTLPELEGPEAGSDASRYRTYL
jgi:hypothetical protein